MLPVAMDHFRSIECDLSRACRNSRQKVRRANDYGRAAELALADKRAEYFEACTLVVWDVDPKVKVVTMYRSDAPDAAIVFHSGEIADAEPAVPGWRIAVEDIFGA